MKIPSLLICLGLILIIQSATAQINAIRYDSVDEKSQLRIGLKYSSDYYYMGRSDSVAAPYLSPAITYYHKSGFFLNTSLSYLTAKEQGRIDMITLSGGYDYYNNNLALGGSLSQYFFSDLSYNVMAEMSTYVNAYAGYDFSWFMLYGDASVGFSGGSDVFLGLEVSRIIYAFDNRLLFTPSLYMNAGTQEYYSQYFSNRSTQTGQGKGKMSGSQPITSMQVLESDDFKILDYEASLMITFKINHVRLFTTGTWTLPVNPARLLNDQGELYEESLKNGFFWNAGVRYTFD